MNNIKTKLLAPNVWELSLLLNNVYKIHLCLGSHLQIKSNTKFLLLLLLWQFSIFAGYLEFSIQTMPRNEITSHLGNKVLYYKFSKFKASHVNL